MKNLMRYSLIVTGISSECPLPRKTKHIAARAIAIPIPTPYAIIPASAIFLAHSNRI